MGNKKSSKKALKIASEIVAVLANLITIILAIWTILKG